MLRRNLSKWLIGAVVAAVGVGAELPRAEAFWWCHSSGGSYGSSGGMFHRHRAYYHSSGGSSGGSYGSYGSSGGSYGAYYSSYGSSGGSSGGSYGSWGSSGGYSTAYYGSHGSSGGSSGGSYGGVSYYGGTYGGSAGTYGVMSPSTEVYPDSPSTPSTVVPPAPSPAQGTSIESTGPRNAYLNVRVPADAKVFVNGMSTSSMGEERRYVSNGLQPGFRYSYELRAEVIRDGQTVTEVKQVKLQAGDSQSIEFAFDGESDDNIAAQPTETKLTLHVPADAKVTLAGSRTYSQGEVREFTTTRLSSGEEWAGYVVRVELEQDGQMLTQEKMITLVGGEAAELTIGFDGPQLAGSVAAR